MINALSNLTIADVVIALIAAAAVDAIKALTRRRRR
jgi:hypothetical protein